MFASLLGPMLSSSAVSEKIRQYSIAIISLCCHWYKILSVFVYLQLLMHPNVWSSYINLRLEVSHKLNYMK